MAWKSGSLTMPADAGGPRAGGNRLQMPNIMRVAVPGGEAIGFVGDASLTIAGGATATIPGGVFATISGSPALATTITYYVTYVTVAAPSVLLACRQQDWAGIYQAADAVGIGYHTDHFDLRAPMPAGVQYLAVITSDRTSLMISLWATGPDQSQVTVITSDRTSKMITLWSAPPEIPTTTITSDRTSLMLSLWRTGGNQAGTTTVISGVTSLMRTLWNNGRAAGAVPPQSITGGAGTGAAPNGDTSPPAKMITLWR